MSLPLMPAPLRLLIIAAASTVISRGESAEISLAFDAALLSLPTP